MNQPRSDRITRETKLVGAVVIVVLLLAFIALYVEPDHTDVDFAWTIQPRTSAILIGAGYTAGAYFFLRLLLEKRWHRVWAGFPAITAFTVCMLAATLLHWSRFHQGMPVFYLWFIIYLLTPLVVPILWMRNRRTAMDDPEPSDVMFTPAVRRVLAAGAGIGLVAAVAVFISPGVLMKLTPWRLTELTARVFAGWNILTFLTTLVVALDGRWSAARILTQSAMVGLALTVLALPRMWQDFDHRSIMSTLFVAGTSLMLLALVGLHTWLDGLSYGASGRAPSEA